MSSTLIAYGDATAAFLLDCTLTPDEVWNARRLAGESGGSEAWFRVALSAADGRDFDRRLPTPCGCSAPAARSCPASPPSRG